MNREQRLFILIGVPAIAAAVVVYLVAGGGRPDISGVWDGEAVIPDVGTAALRLDLEHDGEEDVSGTMRVLESGSHPDDAGVLAVSGGMVDGDGAFEILFPAEFGVEVAGEIDGDSMDAEFSFGGPEPVPYAAERITEEEAARRDEERVREIEEAEQEREAELARQNELQARYEELRAGVGERYQELGWRVAELEDPAGTLESALGPGEEEIEADAFACAMGGVSCEVADFEGLVENDREDLAESDDCAVATDRSYYEEYDFDSEGGSGYVEAREDVADAADGLAEEAGALLEQARESEAAWEEYEEAQSNDFAMPGPDPSLEEVEALAEAARAAASSAEEALAATDARYASYETRVEEARSDVLAVYEGAGC